MNPMKLLRAAFIAALRNATELGMVVIIVSVCTALTWYELTGWQVG